MIESKLQPALNDSPLQGNSQMCNLQSLPHHGLVSISSSILASLMFVVMMVANVIVSSFKSGPRIISHLADSRQLDDDLVHSQD